MQPSDIGRLVAAGEPRVCPDGRTIAFTVTRVDLPGNRYRSAIWLAATDGAGPPYQFSAGEHGDANPVWSPDGRRLAFTRSGGDGGGTLMVAPVAVPGETVTVCTRSEAITEPAWSPDGTRIAFTSRERAARYADGDDDAARPPRRIDRLFSRLDDTGWTVDRPTGVFVVPVDGSGAPRQVAGGPFEHADPAWSPDGTQLAITAPRHPDWDLDLITDVHLVPADGSAEPRRLTDHGLSYSSPSWSPDGTRIAVLAADDATGQRHSRVLVLDAQTGKVTDVTGDLDRQCAPLPGARAPVWDGEALLFPVEDHGRVPILRTDQIADPAPIVTGDRCVTGFDLAGGTLAFTATSTTEQAELHVLDSGGERRLTTLGTGLTGRQAERFTTPSPAGDGDVDAWLALPDEPTDRVPVLLMIHGGPATQYAERFHDEVQLYSAAGYAVLYANPHGSTGGTEAWSRAVRAPEAALDPGSGWAGIPVEDLLAVLDAALARWPQLDADRVGVMGGSYGGYLTSWLVGHTERFAAACSERAVNDLLSLEWTSDAAGLFPLVLGIGPDEEPQAYRRMSPISAVDDMTTPLLILHSEDDLRCPVEQADRLYVALRRRGRAVEYWRFPAESHEMSRSGSPRHRVQRAELILDFLGRHLGGRRPEIGWDHPARQGLTPLSQSPTAPASQAGSLRSTR